MAPTNPPITHTPFDVIVISSPNAQGALAARDLIASSCNIFSSPSSATTATADASSKSLLSSSPDAGVFVLQSSNGTLFISLCAPYGCSMGTGGCTIAALAEADDAYRKHSQKHKSSAHDHDDDDDGNKRSRVLPTVLICHGEGNQVVGNEWSSLPVVARKNNAPPPSNWGAQDQSGTFYTAVTNPISLLISTLARVYADVPRGSVVVAAASDVLLSFAGDNTSSSPSGGAARTSKIDFDGVQEKYGLGSVIGLAVPAPMAAAMDHNVHVIDSGENMLVDERWKVRRTLKILRPPIDPTDLIGKMDISGESGVPVQVKRSCTFYYKNDLMAWIDAGIVAFLPDAAGSLRRALAMDSLKCFTRSGLGELYGARHGAEKTAGDVSEASDQDGQTSTESAPSPEEFAQETTPKMCLYEDILHALSDLPTTRRAGNHQACKALSDSLSKLSAKHDFYTCTAPTGSMFRFRIPREHIDCLSFLTRFATSYAEEAQQHDGIMAQENNAMEKSITMTRRAASFVSGFDPSNTKDSVVVNSVLISKGCNSNCIGRDSLVENSKIECDGEVCIGERCLVSGIRGVVAKKGSSFFVPSSMCLLLSRTQGANSTDDATWEATKPEFVCVCLGIEDATDVSPPKTLFGLEWQVILKRLGLAQDDLWDADVPSSERTLWNAKIHPVLSAKNGNAGGSTELELDFSFLDLLAWLKTTTGNHPGTWTPAATLGYKQWRDARRLSLSEIRSRHDDPVAEAKHRASIDSRSYEKTRLAEITAERLLDESSYVNFDFVLDFVAASFPINAQVCWKAIKEALGVLDGIALRALPRGRLDVAAGAFMAMSSLISDISECSPPPENTPNHGNNNTASWSVAEETKIFDLVSEDNMTTTFARLRSPRESKEALFYVISVRNMLLGMGVGCLNLEQAQKCCDLLEGVASAMMTN